MTANQAAEYHEKGYVVVRGAVSQESIDDLLNKFVSLVNKLSGKSFTDAHSPEIADYLNGHTDVQSAVYNEIRKPDWLKEFSKQPGLVAAVAELFDGDIGMFEKIPFRIDAPRETAQFAVWHQDYFYVRGNVDVVTAWVPMQTTVYLNGCLGLMPGSHKLGPIDHDVTVLGKRHYPSNVFKNEIRFAEVEKGDAILFHSCLLHSSNMNLSEACRYSIQARYTPLGLPTDPGMGNVIPLKS
jgi:ectoine hydroxylase-related dioxygenase (phytanoyl-CoA dioxygenase family)